MRYNVQVLCYFRYLYCNDFNRKTQGGSYAEKSHGKKKFMMTEANTETNNKLNGIKADRLLTILAIIFIIIVADGLLLSLPSTGGKR